MSGQPLTDRDIEGAAMKKLLVLISIFILAMASSVLALDARLSELP
jgi:hypothetical protein